MDISISHMSMRPEFITSDKTAVGEVGQKLEGQEILEEAEKVQ